MNHLHVAVVSCILSIKSASAVHLHRDSRIGDVSIDWNRIGSFLIELRFPVGILTRTNPVAGQVGFLVEILERVGRENIAIMSIPRACYCCT